jgi:hypothetical protein
MAYLKLMAGRVRTARTFEARDPWNRGRRAMFLVEIYLRSPAHLPVPRGWREGTLLTLGAVPRYSIRSELDGVERMIPAFLSDLYVSGSVPVERLPEALHCLGSELAQRDFRPLPPEGLLRLMAGASVVFAIGVLGFLQARDLSRIAFLMAAAMGGGLTLGLGLVWLLGLPRRRRNHAFEHRVRSALAEARA